MLQKSPKRNPFCPYCFEGEIVRDSDTGCYFCEHCNNDVEIVDIRKRDEK